ncbi:hypothetical protein [Streptomyces vinaceus]|uniref:hypothetical protein n=1 Tax=Streptomyces vinaceus TaxID=1960 RepID=UPI0035DF3D90
MPDIVEGVARAATLFVLRVEGAMSWRPQERCIPTCAADQGVGCAAHLAVYAALAFRYVVMSSILPAAVELKEAGRPGQE